MKKLTREQIQQIELHNLIRVQTFCVQHNLKIYLSGGTLLGAIRHHGFIPWDDDIDVCMPRPDYEKFIQLYHENNELPDYLLMECYEDRNFDFPFMKIFDERTIYRREYADEGEDSHLWLDIFPYDGLPSDMNEVRQIYKTGDKYRKYLAKSKADPKEGKTWLKKMLKPLYLSLINIFYSPKRCGKQIEALAKKVTYEKAEYVGAVTWGLYGEGERVKKSEFEKSVDVTFENHIFQTMSCWDSYLKGLYGDYMQLPPKEKRVTHNLEVWIKDSE